jgi:hypothetical protein
MQALIYSVAILLAAGAVGSPSARGDAPDAERAKDRMVCKSIRKTGTRFDTRICKLQSTWKAIEEGSTEALREIQSQPKINCTSPSGAPC